MKKLKPSERLRIEHKTPFPSIGEVVKALFKSTGLWSFGDGYGSVQKRLNRFAKEETILTHEEIQQLINDRLQLVFRNELYCEMAENLVFSFLRGYQEIITREATWYHRSGTLGWCFTHQSLMPLCLFINQIRLVYMDEHFVTGKLYFPKDRSWFLPTHENGIWTMPARRILNWWIKDIAGYSSVSSIVDGALNGVVSQDAIESWMKTGVKPVKPDIATLLHIESTKLNIPDEENKKRSLTALLMISSIVTDITRRVISSIGEQGAAAFFKNLKHLDDALDQHEAQGFHTIKGQVLQIQRETEEWKQAAPPKQRDMEITMLVGSSRDWLHRVEEFYNYHLRESFNLNQLVEPEQAGFTREALRYIWKLIPKNRDANETESQIFTFAFEARNLLKQIKPQRMDRMSEEIRATLSTMRDQQGVVEALKYYCDYMDARVAVIDKDYAKALASYEQAFQKARYRAGPLQFEIAEEFTVLAAELHRRAAKFENPPTLPMLKHLFSWFRLMAPEHGLAAVETQDALVFAYDRYMEIFEMQYIAKGEMMRQALLSHHKSNREQAIR
jgi:hypothetical protein